MYDRLKIPNFIMKSEKYIFKKKLILKSKSKRRLFTEAIFMFIFSISLIYIIYLIPNKNLLLQNLTTSLNKSFITIIEFFLSLYEILLVIFIFFSTVTTLILLIGCFYRIFKVAIRKPRLTSYK